MKVSVLTPRSGGLLTLGKDLVTILNEKGISANHIHDLKNLLLSPFYQDADIIHATIPITYKLWKKPVVLTIQGEYTREKNIWKFFYPTAIRKANVVITSTRFLKGRLNLGNAVVIPNAVFPERFKLVKHLEKETLDIVTMTNFYFRGKADAILNIIKILEESQKTTDKKIKYLVIGNGPYLDQIRENAKKYNVDVRFTGFLQNPKEILEKSDVFVYYSHFDCFPVVILEAMAHGLPIITNDWGAAHEIITDRTDGFVTKSDSDYLKRLLNLLDNYKLRLGIGRNARKTIEGKFNWVKVVDEYIKIYNNL